MTHIIDQAVSHLRKGDCIIYPTETLWAIGCDATNDLAIGKLNEIKKRETGKGYVILVSGLDMLFRYTGPAGSTVIKLLSAREPTTIVYTEHRNFPAGLLGTDGSIAIRVTKSRFCKALLDALGKPLVSTSANRANRPPPANFRELDAGLIAAVQYVVHLEPPEPMTQSPSRIIKVSRSGDPEMLR